MKQMISNTTIDYLIFVFQNRHGLLCCKPFIYVKLNSVALQYAGDSYYSCLQDSGPRDAMQYMSRPDGQPNVKTLCVQFSSKLGTHFIDAEGMKGWVHRAQLGVKLTTCGSAVRWSDHYATGFIPYISHKSKLTPWEASNWGSNWGSLCLQSGKKQYLAFMSILNETLSRWQAIFP